MASRSSVRIRAVGAGGPARDSAAARAISARRTGFRGAVRSSLFGRTRWRRVSPVRQSRTRMDSPVAGSIAPVTALNTSKAAMTAIIRSTAGTQVASRPVGMPAQARDQKREPAESVSWVVSDWTASAQRGPREPAPPQLTGPAMSSSPKAHTGRTSRSGSSSTPCRRRSLEAAQGVRTRTCAPRRISWSVRGSPRTILTCGGASTGVSASTGGRTRRTSPAPLSVRARTRARAHSPSPTTTRGALRKREKARRGSSV